jgi:hypothetical protein
MPAISKNLINNTRNTLNGLRFVPILRVLLPGFPGGLEEYTWIGEIDQDLKL